MERFLLLLLQAAIIDWNRGRKVQVSACLLDRSHAASQTYTLEPASDGYETLKILAANFRLAGIGDDRGQGAERSGTARRAGHQGIVHALERGSSLLGEPHADVVGTLVDDDRRGRGLSLQNGGGVHRSYIGHDLFDVALPIALEFDGEIAAVGFGDGGEAELQTGAP